MIPCKRPKVTIDESRPGTYRVECHIPGCRWFYPSSPSFIALQSNAREQATRHRQEHRAAVPKTWIEKDPEYDVHCQPCGGHRRTFGTRSDAETWLAYHLTAEHGLVVC